MSHDVAQSWGRGGDGRFLGQTGWSAKGSENVECSVGTRGSLCQTARPELCIGKGSHQVMGEMEEVKSRDDKRQKNVSRERNLHVGYD